MKKIIAYVLVFFLISCNSEKNKLENEIENFQNEIKNYKVEELQLKSELKSLDKIFATEQKNISKNYLNKSYYENVILINSDLFTEENKKKITLVNNAIDLNNSNNVLHTLTKNWLDLKKESAFNFLFLKEYRNKKNLNIFFQELQLDYLTSLLAENNIYQNSKANVYVALLLKAKKGFYNYLHYEALEKINTLSTMGYSKNADEINWLISSINNLDESSYTNVFSDTDSKTNILFHIYSFWARRHKEGNLDITYEIMTKIHTKLTNKTQ